MSEGHCNTPFIDPSTREETGYSTNVPKAHRRPAKRRIDSPVVFSGQGSQRVGMGKEFFDSYEESRKIFEVCSDAIGIDLEALCFVENELLHLTKYTQPAILTAEIAMYAAIQKHFRYMPRCFAGHSLGEYSALVAAGVIAIEDAVRIVFRRGELMQRAVPAGTGAMVAVLHESIDRNIFVHIAAENGVELANLNSKDQTVLSGERRDIERFCERLTLEHPLLDTVILQVSAPFHSSHMAGIEAEFEACLRSFEKSFNLDLAPKVLSNYTGAFHDQRNLVDNLVRQISNSVQWERNMEVIAGMGQPVIELGPRPVLRQFFGTLGVEAQSVIDLRSCTRVFANNE